MTPERSHTPDETVEIFNVHGASLVVLVCEHASFHIPSKYSGLGLSQSDATSHAAWDPGALAVAKKLAMLMDAPLVAGCVSRLVYDCNRPPDAKDAMPARSEVIDIPGNRDLSDAERAARTEEIYRPFRAAVQGVAERKSRPVLVTVHSFTPVYHGALRAVEIGILHDSDTRLADAMLEVAGAHTSMNVQRNAPYGPKDGVTHTLKEQAIKHGYLNVMLEIRNDIIASEHAQSKMAGMMNGWLTEALTKVPGQVTQC